MFSFQIIALIVSTFIIFIVIKLIANEQIWSSTHSEIAASFVF